ncbi:MAG: penicillin-binding protein 2 [Armatimonadetes bacterium]|nr:penicillin-binding protein 2 [Armatimonadota bacterium]
MSVIYAPKSSNVDGRSLVFPVLIGVGLMAIFVRLWYIQVVRSAELVEKASHIFAATVPHPAPRGLIYDRNGKLLAGVQSQFVVMCVPMIAAKNPWVIDKVAQLLKVDPSKLKSKLEEGRWRPYLPTPIFIGAPVEAASLISESAEDLPGVTIDSLPTRYYPDPTSFSHVLGYVWVPSKDDVDRLDKLNLKAAPMVGKNGIEYVYEGDLMGEAGYDRMEMDKKMRPLRLAERENPEPGHKLTLTLDADLQKTALKQLAGRRGAAVAIDPNTGEVLCLVSAPEYDSSLFKNGISSADWERLSEDPDKPLLNRAVYAAYPPGSTFKIITSLAALRAGTFDPNRYVECRGYYEVGKRRSKCLSVHGAISFHHAFEKSCNTYFSDLAVRTGPDAVRQAALDCGLYARTNVDLRSESRGVIPTEAWLEKYRNPPKWYTGDTVNLGIGQGDVQATPIQMANLVALVATRGTNYVPHLVKAVTDSGGVHPKDAVVAHHVDAPDSFWNMLQDAMASVVDTGTGQKAKIPGLKWAAKTGSAEHKLDEKTHSWFIGYAPYDHPKIAIAVLVEGAGHGGDIAAPIAAEIVKKYLKPVAPASAH